jgi:hypothetical protein
MIVRSLMRLEKTGRASTKAFVIMPDHSFPKAQGSRRLWDP